jgi:hypothetical protein
MDTIKQGRTLPADLGAQKLAHVNLFLNALGINAEQLM